MPFVYSNETSKGFHSGYTRSMGVEFAALAQDFSFYLSEIEPLFGRRDKSFTFVGLEFAAKGGGPEMRFSSFDLSHVIIVLSYAAKDSVWAALAELAHECAHFLGPWPNGKVPMIEEGMACYFERLICEKRNIGFVARPDRYAAALKAFDELMAADAKAVLRLRARRGSYLFNITSAEIERECPSLSPETAKILAQGFDDA